MTNEEIIKGLQATNEHIGKHFNEGGAWMTEFIDNAIKALEQQPRWIQTITALPSNNDDVLVFDGSDYFVAWYEPNNTMDCGWHSTDENFDVFTPILAWMPLPQPYKAESEDEE